MSLKYQVQYLVSTYICINFTYKIYKKLRSKFKLTFPSYFLISLTSKVVVVIGIPELGGLIGDGEVPPVNKDATIAPPKI